MTHDALAAAVRNAARRFNEAVTAAVEAGLIVRFGGFFDDDKILIVEPVITTRGDPRMQV